MFDFKQDIGLLHGSLTTVGYLSSKNMNDDASEKEALLRIICNSINMILHRSLKEAKHESEKLKAQLFSSQRLHAALFFTTLRSHGIKSKSADEFYESLLCRWPSINLKFYVELNFKCDWSEYFVMCALQLPSQTLYYILTTISELSFENDVEIYSWHLILQTLTFKLLELPFDKKVHYPFDFDFAVESAVSVKEKLFDELTEKSCEASTEEDHKIIENDDKNINKCDSIIDKSSGVYDNNTEIPQENENSASISEVIDEISDEEENDDLIPYSYEISDNDDETTNTESEDLSAFEELCSSICDKIALKLEKSGEVDAVKILLHAIKILLKHSLTRPKRDSIIKLFENCVSLLKDFLLTDANQEKLKIECEKSPILLSRQAQATASWNGPLSYLILLLGHYIEVTNLGIHSLKLNHESKLFYENVISIVQSLYCLNYPLLKSDGHVVLLCKIIQLELEGSSHAAKVLLTDSAILKGKNVLAVLEENCCVINFSQSYPLIINHVMSADDPEMKQNLLKIFYKCLQMNKIDTYNYVIGYILANYGFTEQLQLADYNGQLFDFTFQTPSQEEIEKKVPVLLIQNPKRAMQYLIDQTLLHGAEGEIFIQLLKHFQNACFYIETPGSMCILHEILNGYFSVLKLKVHEEKNMVILCRLLLQVHSETPILFPCNFFSECIIPKLHFEYGKIQLVLECAEVLLPALLSDDSFLKDTVLFCNLIAKFGILTNYFIESGNGGMKSLIISILKNFEIHQRTNKQINEKEKLLLWSTFKDFNKMTLVYFEAFLPEDIDLTSRTAVWIRCCKNEDFSNFKKDFSVENLTYALLVNILVDVLPHLTKDEWFFSFNLVKLCCENQKVKDEIIHFNNPFQLCEPDLDMYAIVSTIITGFHFVINDSEYMSSCFSNFMKDVVCKEKTADAHLLLSIALEFCHLISSMSSDIIHMYKVALLEMKKYMCSRFSDSGQSDCNDLLNHVVSCFPNLYQNESI